MCPSVCHVIIAQVNLLLTAHVGHRRYQLPKSMIKENSSIKEEKAAFSPTRNPRMNCRVMAIGVCVLNRSACRNFRPPYSTIA